MLRLSNSVVGPVTVPLGANGAAQTLEASNIGDGVLSLSLAVEPSATWLTATAGARGAVIALQFQLNTAGLGQGTYTAAVTVSDPQAVDSPQVVTVTVHVGATGPTPLDRTLAPGATNDTPVSPATAHSASSAPVPASPPLPRMAGSVALHRGLPTGHHRFYSSYMIHIAPPPEMPDGTYHGTVTVANSSDDRTIPVTMRVARQPIAWTAPAAPDLRLAQGGASHHIFHCAGECRHGNLDCK